MTRTSKALKRFGVAGLTVVTIGAGIPALLATSASAATATNISISPKSNTAAVSTCTAYTVTVTPAPTSPDSTTVDVLLSQTNPASGTGPTNVPSTLTFCDPDGAGAGTTPNKGTATLNFSSAAGQQAPATGTPVSGNSCTGTAASTSQDSVTRCEAQFTTTGGTSTVTFGVQSDTAGTVNIVSFFDTNANRTPETFEPQDPASLTVVSGKATSLACTPSTQSAPKGGNADFVCTATASTVPSTGSQVNYVITSGPDSNSNAVVSTRCGTFANTNTTSSPTTAAGTNNQGQVTCRVTNGGTIGADQILFFVEQNNSAGPQSGEPSAPGTAYFSGAGRNISCAPKDQTLQSADVSTVTCTVLDAKGNPVAPSVNGANQPSVNNHNSAGTPTYVKFVSTGAGRFVDGSTTKVVAIGDAGQAVIQTTSQVNETGTQTISGTLSDNLGTTYTSGEECNNTAGVTQSGVTPAPSTAGNCSDTVKRTYTANGSASPSPTATTTATATATATATTTATSSPTTPACKTTNVVVNTKSINATGLASVTATGAAPGSIVELQGYSQNHYLTANFDNDPTPVDRSKVADQNGSVTFSDIRPASNTRLRARQKGCTYTGSSDVINVRAQETLQVSRNAKRKYTFSGVSIPARPGGLIISLYRVSGGSETLIGQDRADAGSSDGGTPAKYSITLTLPTSYGSSSVFVVKTGQDAQNAPGRSNSRTLAIS